jgi:hypothetical protein
MDRYRYLLALLFILCTLTVGAGRGIAQTATPPPQPAPVQVKGPPKGCVAGQMRCINNDMRWQAAIRTADRRAGHLRATKGKGR